MYRLETSRDLIIIRNRKHYIIDQNIIPYLINVTDGIIDKLAFQQI